MPDDALAVFREALDEGAAAQREWQSRFDAYAVAFPDEAAELVNSAWPASCRDGWDADLPHLGAGWQADRDPQGVRRDDRRLLPQDPEPSSAARPTSTPRPTPA